MTQMSATCLAGDLDGQLFVTRVTRRLPLVEQELLSHPKHLRSPPVFCCSIFSLQYVGLEIVVCPFDSFYLVIVLSVLRFTGQTFGIFKLTYELSLMTRSISSSFYYSILIPTPPPPPSMQPSISIFYCLYIYFPHVSAVEQLM